MSTATTLRRRDQQVVAKLVEILDRQKAKRLQEARARARSLPTMLRRHGPIPVLLFLQSKEGADPELARWLIQGLAAVLPEVDDKPDDYAQRLAGMPLNRYLLHWQTSVEAAGWLKRLIEARTPAAGSSGGAGG